VSGLEARLGHRFRDPALLGRALTHRSLRAESRSRAGDDYERLEFLGDSLLGFVVSAWLCERDRDATEGELTRRRQEVIRSETLAEAARRLALGGELRMSAGEERTGGRDKESLLADAFEAILGAVYLDGGLRAARAFVRRHLGVAIDAALKGSAGPADDYKSRLQEWAQDRLRVTPRYRIVSATGPDHAREFFAEVRVGGEVRGRGHGASRKAAEQRAAKSALEEWVPEAPG